MKINCIFAERLFSFKYDDLYNCVYERKLYEWQDFEYIYNKALENDIDVTLIDQFFDEIFFDREFFKNEIEKCVEQNTLFEVFKSLNNYSSRITSYEESKAKIYVQDQKRLSRLRLYSLRVNNTCFVITGGAIKFTLKMEDHPDTLEELNKLKIGRQFLIDIDFNEDDITDNLFESSL